MIQQIKSDTFSPGNLIKNILLVHKDTPKKLLATTADIATLQEQNTIDQTMIATTSNTQSVAQCKQTTFTPEDLQANIRPAISSNEDVGRYVGYGRKDISKGGGLSL